MVLYVKSRGLVAWREPSDFVFLRKFFSLFSGWFSGVLKMCEVLADFLSFCLPLSCSIFSFVFTIIRFPSFRD